MHAPLGYVDGNVAIPISLISVLLKSLFDSNETSKLKDAFNTQDVDSLSKCILILNPENYTGTIEFIKPGTTAKSLSVKD